MAQNRRINIVRLIARLNTGGPALHTVLLTRGLNSERFSSCLVTGMVGPGEGDMEYYAQSRGVVPIVVPELGRDIALRNDVLALWKLYRLFCREEPDIIHTHTAKAGGLGRVAGILYNAQRLLAHRPRARLVHSFHGHIFHGYFPRWKSCLFVYIERALARMTDRVATVSETIRRELVEVYRICPSEKVTVIPVGLDLGWVDEVDRHRGEMRRKFHVPADRFTVGIVGRITEIKNHRLFFFAGRMLSEKANSHFFVIGDGELREEMVRIVHELDLQHRVTFTGWQRNPAKIYPDLDVICLTSLNEGTPAVLIEAMAAGRPFVATDVGGVRDLTVGGGVLHPGGFKIFANGILTPPDDPATLTAALHFLAENPDIRGTMGAAGRQLAQRQYSHVRLLGDVTALYMDLLRSARAGSK